jgi:hypothetical protein
LLPPVTVTTGVWPRRPHVRPFGGLAPGRTRLPSRARRPGPPPCFYDRPGVLPPPGDLLLIPLRRAARRDLDCPPDPVQQHGHPRQRVLHPEPPPALLGDPGQRPALIRIPGRRRALLQHRLQLSDLSGPSLHCAPPAPLEASASRPPAASDRRHRFTLIRDTRNCRAISRSLPPASIISAAASRTRSRRARSAASRPPPSGYLIPPAYRATRRLTRPGNPRY